MICSSVNLLRFIPVPSCRSGFQHAVEEKQRVRSGAARTRALDRRLQILEEIAARSSMTLVEISAACDLSPATASRILRTLEMRGFVIRDAESRAYGIGLKAFRDLGRVRPVARHRLTDPEDARDARLRHPRRREPGLWHRPQGLRDRLTLPVRDVAAGDLHANPAQAGPGDRPIHTLAILHQSYIVYLDAQEGTSPLRSKPQVGMRASAHATASGKCLLAARWSEGLIDAIGVGPYVTMTDRTITTLESLKIELAAVRKEGIATDHEELHRGISCLACPVHDRSGEVVAAIGIQAPTSLMTGDAAEWKQLLHAAAVEASLRLGWPVRLQETQPRPTSQLVD